MIIGNNTQVIIGGKHGITDFPNIISNTVHWSEYTRMWRMCTKQNITFTHDIKNKISYKYCKGHQSISVYYLTKMHWVQFLPNVIDKIDIQRFS